MEEDENNADLLIFRSENNASGITVSRNENRIFFPTFS